MTGILRVAGAALLAAMLGLAAWSLHHRSTIAAQRDPDLVGLLELYDHDAFTVVTVTEGIQRVALTPDTEVTVRDTPGTFADLRPGTLVAVWQQPTDDLTAASIHAYPPGK